MLCVVFYDSVVAGWREESDTRPADTLKTRPITQGDVDNMSLDDLAVLFNTKEDIEFILDDMTDSINQIWIIISAINIIAMQLGFTLLEVGSIHPKNKANILIKNLLDTFIGALAFYALGFAFSNGGVGGLVGGGKFFGRGLTRDDALKWLFQFSFCSTSATIVSGSLAERTYIDTYIVFSFLMGSIVYPVASSWVWGGGWLQELGFVDFAGCAVVHELGGFGGFIGTIILGPRIGFCDDHQKNEELKKKRKFDDRRRKQRKAEIKAQEAARSRSVPHGSKVEALYPKRSSSETLRTNPFKRSDSPQDST